ncbi:RecQ family ATP-dependent DNA helicase [Glaciimonas sp. PCH181]|uniref:RecQ family ATP-dependent DNA helicase n=1 Tax=Glaciimonas sp. PCH181 TaxID=2133943 RepID=UPI000D397B4B|nr:RecQ family ATP-dependent DNA helicase [Glaciimonas sp. PCH181]PUA17847.1 RecQ family ATP-dependent DNA helicase [Glaciimonas sp. PCH181]
MKDPAQKQRTALAITPRCLSIDLEVGIRDARIHSFAAVHGETDATLVFTKGDLGAALIQLDELAQTASFLLGHNLIDFDLPHLAAAQPDLRLLKLPAVDTLRLNPLAFPRNPYHHLVKHYKDGRLRSGELNNPELDARLTLDVFRDQLQAFQAMQELAPDLLLAWRWLTASGAGNSSLNSFFMTVRRETRPSQSAAYAAIMRQLSGNACMVHGTQILADTSDDGWALAYALSWLSVAGGNSVMPPWVRHQFPKAAALVKLLRDTSCGEPTCAWCSERHDARKELKRWFGFSDFRPEPADANGHPLQQAIVEAALQGKHVLGILPTGTGKSLCYQIPALSRYDKTGALTVVISPLVALMSDQVAGLEARGISCCAAINGLLSMPERADVLDRVRLGDIGILIVSPEQLRNRALRKVLEQREIGAWILDEAHCISKWGHDFRPDYRYVGRFIKEKSGTNGAAPVMCLTATAKPDVVADMIGHFRDKVGIELTVFNGGANRTNLSFSVVPTTPAEKLAHIYQLLMADLPLPTQGGAIVYCASRKQTEEIAEFLREKGIKAGHFHAVMQPEAKKSTQQQFIRGELQVIVATNAFGMGIDKPDVRLVIHADIPGSLENYMQEAGRAGRDRESARCVLLYTPEDVERQFGMSARSRLTQREIQAILKALKNLDRKKRSEGEIIATAGEILAEDIDANFARDSATDDTRVRTGISWLEEAALLTREENSVQVFPSSLRVGSMDEAKAKLAKIALDPDYRRQLLALVDALISADADEGISTDELMGASGHSSDKVRAALYDLEKFGIASNDTALTAFVHTGVERTSLKRLEEAAGLETTLIAKLQEAAPDLTKGETTFLQLRRATQALKDDGHLTALPEKIARIVQSLANDGRSEDGLGSIRLRRLDAESLQITLQREWSALKKTAELRRTAAALLVDHLLAVLPAGSRGTDLLAVTTLGKLLAVIDGDLQLRGEVKDTSKLLDRALLWLHEQEVIRLNKGLAVFRPAMTIRLGMDKRNFVKADFAPLKLHYDEQIVQIHVMAEYVQRGLLAMVNALQLAMDYFGLTRDDFMERWLPEREKELARQTTPASWRTIVEDLNNTTQQRIVTDDREQTNVLVLAGPGSGKTRVLVHRIAYLVRVKRENPRGILALAYNRHAAVEIRTRLAALIGDDAKRVAVLTCHAFAMRLAGASFYGRAFQGDLPFKEVLLQAIALLKGDGLPPDEADEQRDHLLAAFRWILVDEYQDIGQDQYALISALAGRTRSEEDGRLSLFAVGDDDQNIYAFDGASVEFIRRFEQDYAAKPAFLVENYRSTRHIIEASNSVIAAARNRMKIDNPIIIDRGRLKLKAGGEWEQIDPVGKGRVQILAKTYNPIQQAQSVMVELQRLATLDPSWDWRNVAVIARNWADLDPARCYCELHGIPVQLGNEETSHFWPLRETQALIRWLRTQQGQLIAAVEINRWLNQQPSGPWWDLQRDALEEYIVESTGAEVHTEYFIGWLWEWMREARQRQGGVLLMTAHRAKGLEFDHVAILDGNWDRSGDNEDTDAPRRIFYVAMTRAKKTLTLAQLAQKNIFLEALHASPHVLHRPPMLLPSPGIEMRRRYLRLTQKEVDIGFAGQWNIKDRVHSAISALSAGDAIALRQRENKWELVDKNGMIVGVLSQSFSAPKGMQFVSGSVRAMIVRRRKDTEEKYLNRCRCDEWEVVLPELVFEPR